MTPLWGDDGNNDEDNDQDNDDGDDDGAVVVKTRATSNGVSLWGTMKLLENNCKTPVQAINGGNIWLQIC